MASPRFYCPDLSAWTGTTAPFGLPGVTLPPDEAQHARRVLRLRTGDRVQLFDGRGVTADGIIDQTGDTVIATVSGFRRVPRVCPSITIAAALPRGSRAEDMVNQLSQLGVDAFVPLRCERSEGAIRPNKMARFARIAIESAKQCGRAWLMDIAEASSFADVLHGEADVRLIADAADDGATPDQIGGWRKAVAKAGRVVAMVGPEGGWTDAERAAAVDAGLTPWRFAPHVLRIETAAVAAAALLRAAGMDQ